MDSGQILPHTVFCPIHQFTLFNSHLHYSTFFRTCQVC
nr:MAG TPA: hypothetical protein [Caudoviricetes sp.]